MNPDAAAIRQIAAQFQFDGRYLSAEPYGAGHINRTFVVSFVQPDGRPKRYILQHINRTVFTKPVELMENIEKVTAHLRQAIMREKGDPDRESLTLIPADSGRSWHVDPEGEYWRAYKFIEKTICLQLAEKSSDLYHAARAFGRFQMLLNDFAASQLHETIIDFHHTPRRCQAFLAAVGRDAAGRVSGVRPEIDFVMKRLPDADTIIGAIESGRLPIRVTHNDTKLNNVMLDQTTGEEVCVIDLDTVMPGVSLYDYGDAIRSGATTALEDERDISKVSFDMERAKAFTQGYFETAGSIFTPGEYEMMPWGAKLMTFECGMRFLADYLDGDRYFRIHRPSSNLDRARTQFKMVSDMECQWAAYHQMVDEVRKTARHD
jgi:hypothetical protein